MSTPYYLNWEEDDVVWELEDRLWEEVYIIINEVVDLGVGRNPFEDIHHAEIQHQLDKLEKQKQDKLIQVMIVLGNEDYIQKKKKNEKIRVTVDDVRTIVKDYLKIEIG
jgi:hypothetical protein